MKDKGPIRAQIAEHLKLYSDLGVRYVASSARGEILAARKSEERGQTPAAEVSPTPATLRIHVDASMFDELPAERESLDAVRADLQGCRRCKLAAARTNLVFGSGNPHADLMFVGEAPGADEDEQGLPFVGRAGQLLTKIIEAIGMRREDVYICNILKCRPPGNRNPEQDEIASCEQFLFRQIAAIKPKVICALGAFGAQTLLKTTVAISRLRGQLIDFRGAKLMATFHPAYLLRNPNEKRKVWEDMQIIRDYLLSLSQSGEQ
jgi:uracil-DNA glycosylase family 4